MFTTHFIDTCRCACLGKSLAQVRSTKAGAQSPNDIVGSSSIVVGDTGGGSGVPILSIKQLLNMHNLVHSP